MTFSDVSLVRKHLIIYCLVLKALISASMQTSRNLRTAIYVAGIKTLLLSTMSRGVYTTKAGSTLGICIVDISGIMVLIILLPSIGPPLPNSSLYSL